MLKTNNKTKKTLEQLEKIEFLLKKLSDLDFDNSIANDYKIIYDDKEFSFHMYKDVISCLELLCTINNK